MESEIAYSLEMERCGACGGMFFDRGELLQLLRKRIGASDSTTSAGASGKLAARPATCPDCSVQMQRREMLSGRLTIEVCPDCKGVYLDQGELDAAREILGWK
jgi:Zn-finger nucleic acid-binding protein